jgi:hypothetical protein
MGLSISISNSILSDSMIEGLSPVNIVTPVVSGIGIVGQTLSSTIGTWVGSVPISYSYQWKRNGSPILGANSSSYLLVTADGGTNITCAVTATNTKGSSSSNSNTIAVISYEQFLANEFMDRVIADDGVFEAENCLVSQLTTLNSIA